MSTAAKGPESVRALSLATALADSTSFVGSSEIAEVLAHLGYDVSSLSDEVIASEIDRRCASAVQLLLRPAAD